HPAPVYQRGRFRADFLPDRNEPLHERPHAPLRQLTRVPLPPGREEPEKRSFVIFKRLLTLPRLWRQGGRGEDSLPLPLGSCFFGRRLPWKRETVPEKHSGSPPLDRITAAGAWSR